MHIEELEGKKEVQEQGCSDEGTIVVWEAKRALVGAGARALFYPTLLYNVVRNKMQTEFRWWDRVDQFILLGAVPFPTDVPYLKELGVYGVVTLNEPYETLVPTSLYKDHGIDHLVIPTRDYLFAPSHADICQAVDFIHGNASCGRSTYVHCKAGRGRSTTIVLCYLVKHKNMTPEGAYEHVRSIRPRILLASSQWQAVKNYYQSCVKKYKMNIHKNEYTSTMILCLPEKGVTSAFDDESVVVVTESDLDGYDESLESSLITNKKKSHDSRLACSFQFASKAAAVGRLSCLWLHSQSSQEVKEKLGDSLTSSQIQLSSSRRFVSSYFNFKCQNSPS